ncbi:MULTISPECIES: folate family ECF transporter S component [Clostridium]|uniref:Folate transporter FolT n=1 Tax=Clostridium novyi (strain NT) TaxID=386415 RepID=FOLT_CLONN|nr:MULTISPECIES: folate family ECF transporter S component [Clostridium]A0Q1J7.1 RecName: Full=Folate transporter FolT; AltName: Full=Folate ECF transporter S component FolT [Clostridium novyi NT]ABK62097.1 conserved hypothetical protein [Clostridium novyi NT]KEH88223.1 folate transporter [Clostridium novyi A str. NCTC 538]KEH91344.1 folate transporter [Clostridium novyi A str. BKT29909]KEH94211.1 folate transporter [Clostridium botulinum C/D str. It1]
MKKVNVMIYMAFMITLEIVFTRFLSIQTPIIRIGFGFIPVAMSGMMFGPLLAGIVGATSDVLGMMIFPKGAYFPGFTLSAFVGAVIYGVFFYNKKVSVKRVLLAVGIITVLVNLTMNTIWLQILTGKAVKVLFVTRLVKEAIMFPIHAIVIYGAWKMVDRLEIMNKVAKFNK